MLTAPLKAPLTHVDDDLTHEALDVFIMVFVLSCSMYHRCLHKKVLTLCSRSCTLQILRFMGDPHLNGAQENLFGNYIIQKGLSNSRLRDEILCQIANQVWRNSNPDNAERGWLLLLGCLSTFAPSAKIEKYLLK